MEEHIKEEKINDNEHDKMSIKVEDIKIDTIIESIHNEQIKSSENLQLITNPNSEINFGFPTRGLTIADKRLYHNALERKRREHMNTHFLELHNAVPSIAGLKTSRSQVLIKATEFINIMKRKLRKYELEIECLKHQNKQLEKKLCSLKGMKNEIDRIVTPKKRIIFEDDDVDIIVEDEFKSV